MAEVFSYERVKSFMNENVEGHKKTIVDNFEHGTQSIEEGIAGAGGRGKALSSASGAACRDTWNTLIDEVTKFNQYISALIDAAAAHSQNEGNAEAELSQNLAQTQNEAENIG